MTDAGSDYLESAADRLAEIMVAAGQTRLQVIENKRFIKYLSLILRWNTRINLTSIRDTDGILSRHFVECIACARALPEGIATLLDFGSGAGFPGIPIAICRPELAVTLAESQGKKAAFLREAIRTLDLPTKVYGERGETLAEQFDCVVLRAVDRMESAIVAATKLVRPAGWLAMLTTESEMNRLQVAAGATFQWREPVRLPGGEQRILALGHS